MESRQVRRANERRKAKMKYLAIYPVAAQKGGPSTALIHRNRKHRDDGRDYFAR